MWATRHDAHQHGGVPDWQFRWALTCLTARMIGLENRTDRYTGSQGEVIEFPRRAYSMSRHALLEIWIPLVTS